MTTIQRLFDKRLVIQRLKATSGKKTAFSSTATVDGALQNKELSERTELGVITTRQWLAWVDISEDIKKGDNLVYNGKLFYVNNVSPRDYGINQHIELELKEGSA